VAGGYCYLNQSCSATTQQLDGFNLNITF
jgi:hypothetical protein